MPRKRKLPMLNVVPAGTPSFQRWIIEDALHRCWNGKRFASPERTVASLYASHNLAAVECQSILKHHFRGVEPQRYLVPVFVEVYSDEPVEPAAIVNHLVRASKLYLDTTQHGNGPGESLVLATIDWGRLETVSEVPHEPA